MSSDEDSRTLCKYGAECYQKNPAHMKKYKHPKKRAPTEEAGENKAKRAKNGDNSENCAARDESECGKAEDAEENEAEEVRDEKGMIILSKLPDDIETKIRTLFLVDLPPDFYEFYKFCEQLPTKPVRKSLSAVGLELVGPFDVLMGNVKDCRRDEALRHYRYFYDPPEFLTCLKGDEKTQLHYGYYRDDPAEMPCFVGSNSSAEGCKITTVAANLFGALNYHVDKIQKTADPFRKMQIQRIQTELSKYTKKLDITLSSLTPEMRARRSKVVAKCWHGAGIVVPYDKKTEVGYRDVIENRSDLEKIAAALDAATTEAEETALRGKLGAYVTAANIANDESDFGAALELGLALFCTGVAKLHPAALQLLATTYELLERPQFAEIARAHLANRVKGNNVNTIT